MKSPRPSRVRPQQEYVQNANMRNVGGVRSGGGRCDCVGVKGLRRMRRMSGGEEGMLAFVRDWNEAKTDGKSIW